MLIVVPDKLDSFVAGLTAAKFASIVTGESPYIVTLTLPRFSAETRTDLADTLKAMGMTDAFSRAADFSGITQDERLAVSKVIHQANIDVDEEGTTAAAATVVTGRATMGPGPDYPLTTLNVNKPFLYFIYDKTSGAILFMGQITNPATK
jgi:serpin B